jgi:hypothetical protein
MKDTSGRRPVPATCRRSNFHEKLVTLEIQGLHADFSFGIACASGRRMREQYLSLGKHLARERPALRPEAGRQKIKIKIKMNKYTLAVVAAALLSESALAADGFSIDAQRYNLCKARGIEAVGVATDAIDRKEPVEATLNRLKPPTQMDVKLAITADNYIKGGYAASGDVSLDGLKEFLAGVCYQSVSAR